LNKINRAYSELEQKYEREPTPEELSEILEMDLEEITSTLRAGTRQISVDAPFSDEEGNSLLDVLENKNTPATDQQVAYTSSLRIETGRALACLPERERVVVEMFFGIGREHPMSLEQIGETLDLTRERVRQIKEKAIRRLRASSKSKMLAEYLG
jgi:RNA polymerase primary sigma factor